MNVLITGTSRGIGKATALKFLNMGYKVYGIDIEESSIENDNYFHIRKSICDDDLPDIENINILVNNAGVQNSQDDIDVNLKGAINITEKYGVQPNIKSILFMASASASNGAEFPMYVASKGGIISYMKNIATRIAKYGATSNSISAGGVITEMNDHIIKSKKLWKAVINETMLGKWAEPEEIAEFVYFMTVVNKSMTGQDILIDNGELLKSKFIW